MESVDRLSERRFGSEEARARKPSAERTALFHMKPVSRENRAREFTSESSRRSSRLEFLRVDTKSKAKK